MIRRALLLSFVASLFTTAALAQSCMPGATWCSGAYSYDGMGNIRAIGNDVYIYDTAGRLVSGTADKQRNPQSVSRQDYSYDAFGNRILVSRAGGSVDCLGGCELPVTVDQNTTTNHLTSNNAQYDAAGNLTYIQNVVGGTAYTATYTYDTAGRLARAAANTDIRDFLYTADDERIATANGASWTWTVRGLDGKVLREFTSMADSNTGLPTANRQWSKDYVWREGLLLASVTPTTPGASTTRIQHFHLDHLGTPRLVTDDNGVQLGLHAYYPFGAELNLGLNEQPTELMKFTGHERDVLAGDPHTLDDMHARYEMGTMGRFLSVDRVGGDPFFPQTWNCYVYARNNPLNRVDIDGNADTWFQRAAAATIAFGSLVQAAGAQLNNGSPLGTAVDATLGTAGSLVQGYGDALNLGTSAGEVIGNGGGDAYDIGMAASAEIGRASTIIGTVASIAQTAGAPSTVIGGTTIPTEDGPVPVRGGMVRSVAENGRGVVYRPVGETGDAGAVRVAGSNARNPTGYARIYNNAKQPLVVGTGKPGPNAATHPALTGAATTTPVKAVVPPAPCRNGTTGCSQ
jgi:RHS repeat-associated protein